MATLKVISEKPLIVEIEVTSPPDPGYGGEQEIAEGVVELSNRYPGVSFQFIPTRYNNTSRTVAQYLYTMLAVAS